MSVWYIPAFLALGLLFYSLNILLMWRQHHHADQDDFNWRYFFSSRAYYRWAGRNRRLGPINQQFFDDSYARKQR